jgi:uncharacterized protein (DUF983 family)
MQLHIASAPLPFRPFGFRAVYHQGATNHCPGCGQTQWIVGRMSAQCSVCETAIPFARPFARAA